MGNLMSWSIERLLFWGFIVSFAAIPASIFVVATIEVGLEEMGKKVRKMKGAYVIPLWLGMSLLTAFIPTILNNCFSLNEKMNVIIFWGTVILFEFENVAFWSMVDNGKGENK